MEQPDRRRSATGLEWNLYANQLKSKFRPEIPLLPSGLIGPVKLGFPSLRHCKITIMKSIQRRILPLLVPALTAFLVTFATAGGPKGKMTNPDFTKGDPIPEGATHDWNLGATGARGWMFSDKLVTTDARQIAITKVDEGISRRRHPRGGRRASSASEASRFPMTRAPNWARRSPSPNRRPVTGNLTLTRWRDGKTEEIVFKLPVLGTYSATAPYDCTKSKRILEQGCEALAKRIAEPSYTAEPDHPLAQRPGAAGQR